MLGVGLSLYNGSKTLLQRAMDVLRSFPGSSSYPFSSLQGAYQTNSGPAAAAVNGPVGLELDAMGTVGAELVTNGANLTTTTGWAANGVTMAVVSGKMQLTTLSAGGFQSAYQTYTGLTPNGWYKVAGTAQRLSGTASVYLGFYDTAPSTGFRYAAPASTGSVVTANDYFQVGPSGSITLNLSVLSPTGAGEISEFGAISFVQVTGNHATQTTSINRPTVQRGLFNLLTYSQDFSQPSWGKFNCTAPANSAPDPFGGNTATLVTTTTTAFTQLSQGVGGQSSTTALTEVLWLRAGTATSLDLALYDGVSFTGGSSQSATIISGPGAVVQALGSLYSVSGLSATDWTQVLVTRTGYGSATGSLLIYPRNSSSSNAGDTLIFYRAGLFQGTLTAAQILAQGGIPLTTSAAGSNPTAGPYWASFNGTNQSMALSSVPFQTNDDFCVVACVKQAGLTNGAIFSVSNGVTVNETATLAFALGALQFYMGTGGSTTSLISGSNYPDQTVVATAWKTGTAMILRVNNVQVGSGVWAGGTSAFTVSEIGHFPGSYSTHSNYDTTPIKGTLTLAQVVTLEKAAGLRAGLVL